MSPALDWYLVAAWPRRYKALLLAACLLLADQAVEFAEMFFLLALFCLEQEIHFPHDIFCDRLAEIIFQGFIIGSDNLC